MLEKPRKPHLEKGKDAFLKAVDGLHHAVSFIPENVYTFMILLVMLNDLLSCLPFSGTKMNRTVTYKIW